MFYDKKISKNLNMILLILIFFTFNYFAQSETQFNDEDISVAIDLDLLVNDFVSSHLIDVETRQGIVTLSGSVSNILEKEQSEKIAGSIRGVRSIINNIKVNPVEISDSDLKADIELALLLDLVVSSYSLTVEVDNGNVTLNGNTGSWTEMNLAGTVVKGVRGVTTLKNNVDIVYEKEYSDIDIKNAIERKLELDPYVDDQLVNVLVDDGDVTLSGTVGSVAERTSLYSNAWVAGVNSVDDNEVNILFWADDTMKRDNELIIKTDNKIKMAVNDVLIFDPRVSSFDIIVEVDDGYVTLSGEVDNLKAKKSAFADAANTTGVLGVKNKIKVRPLAVYTDTDIEANIKEAFELDPILESQNFDIKVRNQEARIYGVANSYTERDHAENVASLILGVVEVENYITVLSSWPYKSDALIKADIENEFYWSFVVDGGDINVTVENGIVTLTGEVSSTAELNSAVENAFEGGAKSVLSKLEIEDQPAYESRSYFPQYPVNL